LGFVFGEMLFNLHSGGKNTTNKKTGALSNTRFLVINFIFFQKNTSQFEENQAKAKKISAKNKKN